MSKHRGYKGRPLFIPNEKEMESLKTFLDAEKKEKGINLKKILEQYEQYEEEQEEKKIPSNKS